MSDEQRETLDPAAQRTLLYQLGLFPACGHHRVKADHLKHRTNFALHLQLFLHFLHVLLVELTSTKILGRVRELLQVNLEVP